MDLPDVDTALAWRGRTVVDAQGEELGKVSALYLDAETQRPAWAGVKRGLLRGSETLVPLAGAAEVEGGVRVAYDRAAVEGAPDVDPDVELSEDQERVLYEHYRQPWAPRAETATAEEPGSVAAAEADRGAETSGAARDDADTASGETSGAARDDADTATGAETSGAEREDADRASGAVSAGAAGDDARRESGAESAGVAETTSAPGADTEGIEVVRSEEEVELSTRVSPRAERVRLRKVLVDDEVTQTVPVRKEVVQLETDSPPEGTIESVEPVDDDRS